MRKNSKKLLTLMLAGALCAATVGGVATLTSANADNATTYALTNVFSASDKTLIGAEVVGSETNQTAKFSFKKDSWVEFNRDLALKWFEGKAQAKYMSLDFAFANMNFTDLSFVFEVAPAQAVEGDKAINTIKFVKVSDTEVSVKVYAGEEEPAGLSSVNVSVQDTMAIALGEGSAYGEFAVTVNGTAVGSFTNVGANYADTGSVDTLVMKATPVENATENPAIYLKKLNNQSFNNITGTDTKMVADDAAPVLVVNQDVSSFLLGTQFSLAYEKIDVLKSSSLSETKKYYQWNPTDTEINETTFTTAPFFMDTVYEEGGETTSVYREYGEEYVSISFELGDGSADTKKTYELAWYASDVVEKTVGSTAKDYIKLNRNEEGPQYKHITADETSETNVVSANLEQALALYQAKLDENAAEVYAGSNAELKLPALDWFVDDNNGYRTLQFTISYKTPTSDSATNASNKKYNALEIPTTSEGVYEFKVFASDAAGNAMQYYLDGELVKVTTNNVWDIEEIPSFTFEVENKGIKTADGEDSDTLDKKILDENYTMSEVKIVGARNESSAYVLYKFSDEVWNMDANVAETLSKIKFAELNEAADALAAAETNVAEIDYADLYKKAFIKLAAEKLEKTEAELANCLTEINVYNGNIPEDDEDGQWHNQFNWSKTSRRFAAVEEGLYLIIADYWDEDLAVVDRVPAYQLIEVAEEEDTIKGESEWLKNNLVSIILFGVAGVCAIAIVVLIFVKPSKETLEDVDKAAKK